MMSFHFLWWHNGYHGNREQSVHKLYLCRDNLGSFKILRFANAYVGTCIYLGTVNFGMMERSFITLISTQCLNNDWELLIFIKYTSRDLHMFTQPHIGPFLSFYPCSHSGFYVLLYFKLGMSDWPTSSLHGHPLQIFCS